MDTSTGSVVEFQMEPISASIALIGQQFTAQAALNQFAEFRAAALDGAGKTCAAIVSTVVQGRNATAKEFALATSAVVESTRSTVDNKRVDGPDTALARKFQSYTRAAFGAVINGLMSIEEVQCYGNSQALYDTARKLLNECQIDWSGVSDAEKAQKRAHKANTKAVNEAAEELGIDSGSILEMDAADLAELRAVAKSKLADKEAKAKLEAMEKRTKKLVEELKASFGTADALKVLAAAMDLITAE